MYKALDTETVGLEGDAFMVIGFTEEEQAYCWEWNVEPCTLCTFPSQQVKDEISHFVSGHTIIFHNASFDLWKLRTLLHPDVLDKVAETCHDTMNIAHFHRNTDPRGLKWLGDVYLDLVPDEQSELEAEIVKAKAVMKRLGLPFQGPSGNFYWAPRQYLGSDVCSRYGIKDVKTTLMLFLLFKSLYPEQIEYYEHYISNRI